MSTDNNPFASAGGQYAANVSYGAPAATAPAPVKADLIKDTTTQRFSADVIQESRNQVVLVDFWAPWCGPCKQLTPVLEKVVNASNGKVKLVKMNIDDHPAVAGQLGIQSIPAVIAFKNGQPVDGFMGALPETKVREFIDKVAGPGDGPDQQIEAALAAARQAAESGDMQTAADIFQEVLAVKPDSLAAIVGLAGLLVDAGDVDAAQSLLDNVAADKAGDAAVVGLKARIALALQTESLGDPAELRRRLEANPKDHQARFDLAMLHNARGERDEAADCLLAIMKADRAWNDDGARKQLLLFFEAWGMTDGATLAGRRKLSSLLFA
jgi:putative thioredoxin